MRGKDSKRDFSEKEHEKNQMKIIINKDNH